jgi:hypothetical protein
MCNCLPGAECLVHAPAAENVLPRVANAHDCYWRREAHVLTRERDALYAAIHRMNPGWRDVDILHFAGLADTQL